MGVFPKWPVMLHAEPRLWGVLVLDDPRNPADWRGRRVEFSRLRAPDGNSPGWLPVDDNGRLASHNGRPVYLRFRTPSESWVSFRTRARAVKRSLGDGSLDVVVASSSSHTVRRLPGVALALVGVGWLVGVWLVVQHHRSLPPSTVVPIDLPAKLIALSLLVGIGALYTWVAATILRLSCTRYRLTCDAIVPLDGPLVNRTIRRAEILSHRRISGNNIEVRMKDTKVYLQTPPLPFSAWMGTEKTDRERERRRDMRTLTIAGGVIVVGMVAGALLLPADEAPPPQQINGWVGVGLMVVMLAVCAWLLIYVVPRLNAWEKSRARRHREKERAARLRVNAAST